MRTLASRSGVSASMISDVERGMKSPTISTLAALADALELPLSTLVESPAPTRMRVVKASERHANFARHEVKVFDRARRVRRKRPR